MGKAINQIDENLCSASAVHRCRQISGSSLRLFNRSASIVETSRPECASPP